MGYAAGLKTAGVLGGVIGGVIATVAMILPAALLMYLVTLSWKRAEKSKWRVAVEKGFAPLTVGLILATSLVMSRAADHDWRAYLITAVATADLRPDQDQSADRGRRRGTAGLSRPRLTLFVSVRVDGREIKLSPAACCNH